jgi:signal transduction histidine kinase
MSPLLKTSKQLTGLTSQLVFAFVSIAGISDIFFKPMPPTQIALLGILFGIFILGGTVGWRWTQRTGRYRLVYYVGMVLIGDAILFLSTVISQTAIDAAIIMLPLTLHGAVLSRQARYLFLTGILVGAFLSILMIDFPVHNIIAFIAFVSGVLAFDFMGQVIVREETAHQQLALYAREIEELSMMRERNRIAREIHDNLGHYLTAINMQAQAAQAVLSISPAQTDNALAHIQNLAREGLQEVRKSIAAMRELPMERRSLYEAIESLVKESRIRGLAVDFQTQHEPILTPVEVEITLYRVIQEALTNIHKHAHATQASILLTYHKATASIHLSICDNGIGAEQIHGGFGLLGLRERVQLLGGSFQSRTTPQHGFCIEVELKLWTK